MKSTPEEQSDQNSDDKTEKSFSIWSFFRKKNQPVPRPDEAGFYLGNLSKGVPYYLTERQLENHLEIAAQPEGAARLLNRLINDRIQQGHGIIFLNMKSESSEASGRKPNDREWIQNLARTAGRETELRLISLGHPENSTPYNPIQHGTAPEIHEHIMNSMAWSDEVLKNISSIVLLTLLRSLCDYRDKTGEIFHFGRLYDLLNEPGALHAFHKKLIASQCQISQAMQFLIGKLDQAQEREKLRDFITHLRLLSQYSEGKNANFDLNEALDDGRITFFQLNQQETQETAQIFGKMVLQDLMRIVHERYIEMSERKASIKPVMLVIDDFSSLVVPRFSDFMNGAKVFDIGIVFVNSARVEKQIASQVNTVIALGAQSLENADYLSSMAGASNKQVISQEMLTRMGPEESFVVIREGGKNISASLVKLNP